MNRKTRKFPEMPGSIQKRKKDLSFAKRFDKWYKIYCPGAGSKIVLSEPISNL